MMRRASIHRRRLAFDCLPILLNVITLVYGKPEFLSRILDIPVLKEVEAIMDPAAFTIVRFTVSTIPFLPFALGLLTSDAGRASFISMFIVRSS
ncbi:hypothetical protein L2E82_33758 [Cichorium intybus]|uniref:Uncharacterized protein n=1 Tax=Cichorium intybus TaxID=13427 RepID=A0ACB9BL18_CICIN|nr:hypothetical protein L2E82_33758 [Cichorium intybus]